MAWKMTAADRRRYKKLLLDKRQELCGDVDSMESQALRAADQDASVDHVADFGSDNYEQTLTLGLIENNGKLLQEIDAALERIADRSYGYCVHSGEAIAKARLDAIPWTPYSIETQRLIEQGELTIDDGE